MSEEKVYWFKARIPAVLDDAIRQLAIELAVERSEAGRELFRRGAGKSVTPVIIRPNWSDKDLHAINQLRKPAHQLYQAAKELRTLVDEECGANMELRGKIAEAASQVYSEYVAIRDLRDGLTGLTAEEAVSISKGVAELEALAEKDNPTAAALVKLLLHLGF